MFWQDKIGNYPVCMNLVNNYDIIKKEILNHISIPNILQDYPNYKVLNDKLIYDNYWKATPCSVFKDEHVELNGSAEIKQVVNYFADRFRENCPVTHFIIKDEEAKGVLTNSFISRLIPGTVINPHHGWTKKYMRIHFGIVCDPECKITVNGETATWKEGKILAFNDGDTHSVVHNGTKERVIFSIDVALDYLKQYMF